MGLALAVALGAAGVARAQLKLGVWDVTVSPSVGLAYNSNVDGAYPEEESETLQKGDFYLMPAIGLTAAGVRMRPDTLIGLSGNLGYEDYFKRNDLDTETYDAALTFQTVRPWTTLNGSAGVDYSVESEEDTYYPGGAVRDPSLTLNGALGWQLKWNRLLFDLQGTYTRERHDYEEYQMDDQDEIDAIGTLTLQMWEWMGAYVSYEWDDVQYRINPENDETTKTLQVGLTGSFSFFNNPQLTYSVGLEREDTGEGDEDDGKWKPTHDVALTYTKQLQKNLDFAASVTWSDDVEADEVSTTFDVSLKHVVTAYFNHSVSATMEPRDTIGSNADTETITYAYTAALSGWPIKGANFGFTAQYEEERPLDDKDALTEDTTTFDFSAGHTRELTRRLSRSLTYTYSWENSNFHHDGAMQEHAVIYSLQYRF